MALRVTDEDLVRRTLEGNTRAFAALVERYRDAAYGIGLHVLGDPHEAAEVAQDAFVRAWQALGQLREPAKFPAWLCRIAGNLARRRLSVREGAARAASLEKVAEMKAPSNSPSDSAEQSEILRLLGALMETLPDNQRLAFTLFYVDGYSYSDLGRMLDLPEGTVKTHLHRARAQLKRGFVEMAKNTLQEGRPDAEFWRSATGTAEGRVTDAQTGEPIEGAKVRLYEPQTKTFADAQTNRSGEWTASDLVPGAYSISVRHPDYVPGTYRGRVWFNVRTSVVVRPGQTASGIDFALEPGCRLTGHVVGRAGAPVAGAQVTAWRRMEPPHEGVLFGMEAETHADGDGRFEIRSLPPDDYLLGVQSGERDGLLYPFPITFYPSTLSLEEAERISLSADAATAELDIRLTGEGTAELRVHVLDEETGSPIPDALVVLNRRDAYLDMFAGRTDSSGGYRTAGLAPGPYQVTVGAEEGGYPRWSKWFEVEGDRDEVEMEFALPKGAYFEGEVVTEDSADLPPLDTFFCWFHPAPPEEIDGDKRRSTGILFSVHEKDANRDFSMSLEEGPQYEPVEEVIDGRFRCGPVYPGEVRITGGFPDKNWRWLHVASDGDRLADPVIACGAGEVVRGLQLVLGTNLGVVAGRVVSTNGSAVEGLWVCPRRLDDEPFLCLPAETDRSGSFLFHSIPAGPYGIGVARESGGPIEEGSRREITVEPNEVVHLDLLLPGE
jgi:RNA polymerase sigma-70 factor (ECF subfamily)